MDSFNRVMGACAHCQEHIVLGDEQLSAIACCLSFSCTRCNGCLKLDCPLQLQRLRQAISIDQQMAVVGLAGMATILASYLLMRMSLIEPAEQILSSYVALGVVIVLTARWKVRRLPVLMLQPAPLFTLDGRLPDRRS